MGLTRCPTKSRRPTGGRRKLLGRKRKAQLARPPANTKVLIINVAGAFGPVLSLIYDAKKLKGSEKYLSLTEMFIYYLTFI